MSSFPVVARFARLARVDAVVDAVGDAPDGGWLRSRPFDLALIVGVLSLALVLGGAASLRPDLLGWVLLADVWLLAYPHVGATFARVVADRARGRIHPLVFVGLLPLVLAATAAVGALGGVVALNSVYFYWQAHHYTKQSYGIARAYQRRGGRLAGGRDGLTDTVVFAFPIWGVLHRAEQRPALFYGSPLWTPPVPAGLVSAASAIALVALAAWTWREIRDGSPRRAGGVLFVLSHVVITVLGYVAIADVTLGWVFLNVWHNAQYLLFVWAAQARGRDGGRGDLARHLAVCAAVSVPLYLVLAVVLPRFDAPALPVVMVVHLAINFHHYLVDGVIWRTRRRREAAPAS